MKLKETGKTKDVFTDASWDRTTLSKIFNKDSFDIARLLHKTVQSKFGFLRSGYTTACLKQTGTFPIIKLLLGKD